MRYVKFIARPDTWFKEGTEAFVEALDSWDGLRLTVDEFKKVDDEWVSNMFVGLHVDDDGRHKIDGELCGYDEFDIVEDDDCPLRMTREELKKYYKV